jgi:hypothetical protein
MSKETAVNLLILVFVVLPACLLSLAPAKALLCIVFLCIACPAVLIPVFLICGVPAYPRLPRRR